MLGSTYLVGCLVDHLAGDAGIFNLGVPVSKATPLLFLFFWRHYAVSGFVEQLLQARWHD
jgi:hypothetical protein